MTNKNDGLSAACELIKNGNMFSYDYLPLAAAYCRRLGLVELVNRMVPSEMELSPGLAVQSMVLDTLSGRTPLYRLEEFMETQDTDLLLGEKVPSRLFNDNNLARSLDALFEAGSSKILTEVGIRAAENFSLDATRVNYDTTSRNVWGAYYGSEDESRKGPAIVHGKSKDKRPDLKQFMTELLCVERGIPIFGRTLDGNSSDKTSNNKILSRISSIMAKHGLGTGAFVYVADAAMVTRKNLECVGDNLFISRFPANFSACGNLIRDAVESDNWTELGQLAENPGPAGKPSASYKICDKPFELYGKEYRGIVVHSDAYDKRRMKKLDRNLKDSEKELRKQLKSISSVYFCEADAKQAAGKAEKLYAPLHHVEVEICPFEARGPGRPPENRPAKTRTKYELKWEIKEKKEVVEKKKTEAGCFVLISNTPIEGDNSMSGRKILKVYKGQYGIESDFAFLKDPIVVNDIFLKKPHRIDALGMILVIALMIWRLMERVMRAWVGNTGKTLPGWEKRRTYKPTSFMVSTAIYNIQGIVLEGGGRCLIRKPNRRAEEYLQALGLDENVFTDCHFKCKPIIPQKNTSKG
ncbi:hypothetical protein AKJ51_04960 [candidate division MSBL1 archaeon SCGC-AAA382A20]|uniref:DUF4277 domain-containing protein n=1 Tax=candidate division MSBL1 archaeon SCGC-AAA382A20 TaxID=1698280 RepID=A0A133VGG8_9EURY|nr:hypothetical protein AKJ51_04960 [candidate division MSBL1 archaeon SCGC-AAA382A20]